MDALMEYIGSAETMDYAIRMLIKPCSCVSVFLIIKDNFLRTCQFYDHTISVSKEV
jgi:hypothetical protein